MRKISRFFRNLFDFSKPVIYELECMDLIIEDHALLLLSWQFKNRYTVKVCEAKASYGSVTGSAIIKLSQEYDDITVIVSNFWRKRKKKLPLRKIQMDESTVQLLISELHLMPLPAVNQFNVELKKISSIQLPHIHMKHTSIRVNPMNIHINATSINYTAK
jgi:hypothetical protein